MPGYATIVLRHHPAKMDTLPDDALEALEAEFDRIFTRDTERKLAVLVTDSDPEFIDLRARLDSVLAATQIGEYGAGRITGSDAQVVNEEDWTWDRWKHNASRSLYLDGNPFEIRAPNTNWTASVVADYQWTSGVPLP